VEKRTVATLWLATAYRGAMSARRPILRAWQQHRALQLLAGTPFGATEAAMFLNGFKRQTLVHLIRAGLATTERENLKGGSRSIGRVRITEVGRQALECY
jgi:hypothetical protein